MEIDLVAVISEIVRLRKAEDPHKCDRSIAPVISTQDFSDLVEKITQAYHLGWEKEKLELAQNFLARTWSGMPLPVLSICGRGTQEIRYSKYLGYFLDPSKSHGLKSRFLDEFLSLVPVENIDTYNAKVETEKWIGKAEGKDGFVDCVCDNVITCDHHVIFIEQKINSGESNNRKSETTQLVRYYEAIEGNEEFKGKKRIRIYLTPTGKQSVKSDKWTERSHIDLVTAGMNVLSKGGISGVARDNLKRFLLDLLLGPFKKTEEEIHELVELAKAAVIQPVPSFEKRVRFDRLKSRNERLFEVLMEG